MISLFSRTMWTDESTEKAIMNLAGDLERMPTAKECGHSLASRISRTGGFRQWAKGLGLSSKPSETLTGQEAEDEIHALLESQGCLVVKQSTKAPFDLLCEGKRIDVKVANWSEYENKSGGVSGFVFSGLKNGLDCDSFILVCRSVGGDRYFDIPARDAKVQTITITKRTLQGIGKYSTFERCF